MNIKMNINPVFKGLYKDHYGRLCFALNIAGFSAMFYIFGKSSDKYQLWSCQVEYDRNFDDEGRFLDESSFYKYIGSSDSIMSLKILAIKWMTAVITDNFEVLRSLGLGWTEILPTEEFYKMFVFVPPRQWNKYKMIREKRIEKELREEPKPLEGETCWLIDEDELYK